MRNSAFTLVELAIVIVIIGLLVGGVLQGQELIKQAQIQKYIKLTEELSSSKNTFYAKYNGLPGDLRNASTFFDNTACLAILYSSAVTCDSVGANGGNGLVDGDWNNAASDPMRYFVHLTLSKMLAPKPNIWSNGYTDYSYYDARYISAKNVTSVIAGNGGLMNAMTSRPKPGTAAVQQPFANINYFHFVNNTSSSWDGSNIDPQGLYKMDTKLDDGKPLSGKLLAGTGSANSAIECIIGTDYDITSNVTSCNFFLQMD